VSLSSASRVGFVVFGLLFFSTVSFFGEVLEVDAITCGDTDVSNPGADVSTFDQIVSSLDNIMNLFFGCSAQNEVVSGLFTALGAGMVIVVLSILKDVIPFT
jgi:hypothetical protein